MPRRDGVERGEDAEATRIEIFADATAARAFAEIGIAAVLAAEKPSGQAEIGDDADLLHDAEVEQRAVEAGTVVEIVFRLQHLVARQRFLRGDLQCRRQLAGVEIGRAGVADLALLDQPLVGAERLVIRH